MPSFSGRNCEPEGASNESGIHHQANQGRDFKIESGIASARRPSEKDDAGQGTTTQTIHPGRKRIVAAQRSRWAKIRAAKK